MSKNKGAYNFKFISKNDKIHTYYDEESVRLLHIFKSGWKDKYHCIIEDPQYEQSYLNTYSCYQIEEEYNIKNLQECIN